MRGKQFENNFRGDGQEILVFGKTAKNTRKNNDNR